MATTLNPADKAAIVTLSDANHVSTVASTGNGAVRGTSTHNAGKWYLEFSNMSFPVDIARLGLALSTQSLTHLSGGDGEQFSIGIKDDGLIVRAGFTTTWGVPDGHTVGMAVDIGAGTYWFTYDGSTWNVGNSGTPNPATGVGPATWANADVPANSILYPYIYIQRTSLSPTAQINCGDRAFAYSVPSGFTAWDITPIFAPSRGVIIGW